MCDATKTAKELIQEATRLGLFRRSAHGVRSKSRRKNDVCKSIDEYYASQAPPQHGPRSTETFLQAVGVSYTPQDVQDFNIDVYLPIFPDTNKLADQVSQGLVDLTAVEFPDAPPEELSKKLQQLSMEDLQMVEAKTDELYTSTYSIFDTTKSYDIFGVGKMFLSKVRLVAQKLWDIMKLAVKKSMKLIPAAFVVMVLVAMLYAATSLMCQAFRAALTNYLTVEGTTFDAFVQSWGTEASKLDTFLQWMTVQYGTGYVGAIATVVATAFGPYLGMAVIGYGAVNVVRFMQSAYLLSANIFGDGYISSLYTSVSLFMPSIHASVMQLNLSLQSCLDPIVIVTDEQIKHEVAGTILELVYELPNVLHKVFYDNADILKFFTDIPMQPFF